MGKRTLAKYQNRSGKRRAIIYARVSKDKSKEIRSIVEQVDEGRKVIAAHSDWYPGPVIAEDEAISASRYAVKDRPGYRKLLMTLREGDVLVVWAGNRPIRQLDDWVELRKLCETLGVLLCAGGRVLDLSDPDDRFSGGIDALIAERDVDHLRKNVMRALNANLEQGKPHSPPPFGYRIIRDDQGRKMTRLQNGKLMHWEYHPVEAPLIREAARRALAGESLHSLEVYLADMGARGKRGGRIRQGEVRKLLVSPTLAGRRVHKGKDTGPGAWPALIDPTDHERLVAKLTGDDRLTHRGSHPKYLVAGVATCGECGSTMKSATLNHGRRYYTCRARREGRVTGTHPTRECRIVDEVVDKFMRHVLSDRDVAAGLSARLASGQDDDWEKDLKEARRKEAYLREYIDAAADPDAGITPQALARLEGKLRPEIEKLYERVKSSRASAGPAAELLGADNSLGVWGDMSVRKKKETLQQLLKITILTTGRGYRATEKDIRIRWNDAFAS